MSGFRLGRRDRRALLLGVAVLAPFFLFQYGLQPYLAARADVNEQLRTQRDLLTRELALLAQADAYPEAAAASVAALEEIEPRLFSGPDEISASGALVSYLGGEAERHRVLLQQSETRAAETTAEGLLVLAVGLRGMSDLQGLLSFLHALETGGKLVRVEQLGITRSGSAFRSGRRDEEVLQFSALVSGYALADAEGPRASPSDTPTVEQRSGRASATGGGR